jgi:hypothetical protein
MAADLFDGVVGTSVVDENDFMPDRQLAECRVGFVDELVDAISLEIHWNDQ